MPVQQKPIKEERINNPDGTYTIKKIYDKPDFDGCLSDIEIYDSSDKMLNGTYYDDRKFKKLLYTERREYLDNGQYYVFLIWEETPKDDYISVKALGDSNNKLLKTWFYEDKQSTDLLLFQEIEYLENNTTKIKNVSYKDNTSLEIYLDAKDRRIKSVSYNDLEFKNISETRKYFYNKCFGQYVVKTSYEKCDKNGWCESEELYDKHDRRLSGIYKTSSYKDNTSLEIYLDAKDRRIKSVSYNDLEFKNISETRKYFYNKCFGQYVVKTSYEKCDKNGWCESEELYDKNDRLLSGIYKTSSKAPNQVIKKLKYVYNSDDTYDWYCSYIKQAKDKSYLSYIERYTSDDKFILSKFYRDRNFKKLYYTCERKYIAEGHYVDNIVEDNIFRTENYKSRIFETNENEKWEKEKYYKTDNFTDLLVYTYKYVNANGNIEKQIIYENDQGGWYSTIFEEDKHNRTPKQEWYSDKDFKELCLKKFWEYQDDNNYSETSIYETLENDRYNTIEFYKNNKLSKTLFYKDKELTKLYATKTSEYLSDKKSVEKIVFEEPCKNMFSGLEYRNEDGKCYYCLGYSDKEFKNLYRTVWAKYTKNSMIYLRIYTQKQDGYNVEIEKYDSNENLIYKKQYNTNVVFARILFWLAR